MVFIHNAMQLVPPSQLDPAEAITAQCPQVPLPKKMHETAGL